MMRLARSAGTSRYLETEDEAAIQSLENKAMILGLEMSMADMKARNIVPHANSAGALAYLKNREV